MKAVIKISRCPTCGSKNINRVRRDVTMELRGEEYTVPALEFEECPDCGEKVYDREAMRTKRGQAPRRDHTFPRITLLARSQSPFG